MYHSNVTVYAYSMHKNRYDAHILYFHELLRQQCPAKDSLGNTLNFIDVRVASESLRNPLPGRGLHPWTRSGTTSSRPGTTQGPQRIRRSSGHFSVPFPKETFQDIVQFHVGPPVYKFWKITCLCVHVLLIVFY